MTHDLQISMLKKKTRIVGEKQGPAFGSQLLSDGKVKGTWLIVRLMLYIASMAPIEKSSYSKEKKYPT